MKINQCSVLVDDQARALSFYTETLGFQKKHDIPLGKHRWLTVVSPEDPDGTELVLEPDEHPAAKPFKSALVEDGIPFTSFAARDVVFLLKPQCLAAPGGLGVRRAGHHQARRQVQNSLVQWGTVEGNC